MPKRNKLSQTEKSIEHSRILLTGSTGYIGGRLLGILEANGYKIRCLARRPEYLEGRLGENTEVMEGDLLNFESLLPAMEGIHTAYYLVHSMGTKGDFEEEDRQAARNFRKAAEISGVSRIVYLGGLCSRDYSGSPHMRSRREVGEILRGSKIQVLEFQASIIIGSGSLSFELVRSLVERLPVMIIPRWVCTEAQPVALKDVLAYLTAAIRKEIEGDQIFEIGGPDKMTYEKLMRVYAKFIKKNIFIIEIPFLTTRLSSYWVDLITPVKASLARPLVDSLVHDTVVTDDKISKIIPFERKTVIESIEIATKEMAASPPETDAKTEKTGFKVNQKILLITFIGFAICGTTYYWIDDRADVYSLGWILGSIIWYAAIGFGIIFVYNKTRLGYLIGGVLSWVTLAFWMFDNYYIVFQMSLIAEEPNFAMTVRNFVGIAIAFVAVVSSHNLFHKVIDYQYRGKQIE